MVGVCYHCGAPFDEKRRIAREDECPSCGRDMHVCRNCKFYAKGVAGDCRETNAERISVKDRRNFCDYFTARESASDTAKKSADASSLFKDGTPKKESRSLGDLFKGE